MRIDMLQSENFRQGAVIQNEASATSVLQWEDHKRAVECPGRGCPMGSYRSSALQHGTCGYILGLLGAAGTPTRHWHAYKTWM